MAIPAGRSWAMRSRTGASGSRRPPLRSRRTSSSASSRTTRSSGRRPRSARRWLACPPRRLSRRGSRSLPDELRRSDPGGVMPAVAHDVRKLSDPAKYDRLVDLESPSVWWRLGGPLGGLHLLNEIRVPYFERVLGGYAGKRILDVG